MMINLVVREVVMADNCKCSCVFAVKRAIEIAGSQHKLAKALTGIGLRISQAAVFHWTAGDVKPQLEYAFGIEVLTKGEVRAEMIRDDLSSLIASVRSLKK